ncbi:uncharacterized protein LOC108106545 [Drosophila eugracilis]|uniref:uncharacterized protein LOC108106545 n=1 Tax=Drosophila eugracilis TaxID=29029 RepID=UPI0007E71410|nr:uncharacterized protein LOC108106545 [Drosophila eugracilis]XP_017069191.1 uncharacterized protein LOC108106545 [Drosophila eugracilis]
MHVRNFLCCLPLKHGVVSVGAAFGLVDFLLGCYGWEMVIADTYPEYLVEFFRTMDTRVCVAGFSALFWVMMVIHCLLLYGVFCNKFVIIGTWLLINYVVYLFTLVTVLLDSLAIFRIIAFGYCLIVVKSYYAEMTMVEETSDSSRGASDSDSGEESQA